MITLVNRETKGGIRIFDFGGIYNGDPCGTLQLEIVGDICSLHLALQKWSHNVFKMVIADWNNTVLPFIRGIGCKKIIVTYKDEFGDVKKWRRFIYKLGFPKPETVYISTAEV